MPWTPVNNSGDVVSAGGTASTTPFTNPLVPGSAICLAVWVGPTVVNPTSITDTAGNTYVLLPNAETQYQPVVAFVRIYLYYALNISSSLTGNSITCTCTQPFEVFAFEIVSPSGNRISNADANSATVPPVVSSTTTTSPNIVTAADNELIIGMMGAFPGTFTPTGGPTLIQNGIGGQGSLVYLEAGAAGTYNLQWAGIAGSPYGIVAISFLYEAVPGHIIVRKVTDPPGSSQSFHFAPSYGEPPFDLMDGESNDSGPLDPGTYSVVETVVPGWNTTVDTDPSNIVIVGGETITVTFTNTLAFQPGRYLLARDITTWADNGQLYTNCFVTIGSIQLSAGGSQLVEVHHIVGYFDAVGDANGSPSQPNVSILPNEISATDGAAFIPLPEVLPEPPYGAVASTTLQQLRWPTNMGLQQPISQLMHHLQVMIQFAPESAPNTIKQIAIKSDQD